LDAAAVAGFQSKGKAIFDKFEKYLKKAVCDDFKYCQKRDDVKKALNKYLPDIVKAIIARLPITGKLPAWLVPILTLFGIPAASLEVLVTLFVAWIIIKGCDELCGCK